MTYNCTIEKQEDGMYVAQFPDMTNILTCGYSHEEALKMAEEALNGVLAVALDHRHPIAEPKYTGGYPIEVSPNTSCRKCLTDHFWHFKTIKLHQQLMEG